MDSIELKIRAKALAAEAKIIRHEEQKAKARATHAKSEDRKQAARSTFSTLQSHRRHVVRRAARSTHLARAFLRGLRYRHIEAKCREMPDRAEILKLLTRYGTPEFRALNEHDRTRLTNEWFDRAAE